jgi:hypothetical protein
LRLARVTKVYRESSQERHATEYNGAAAVSIVFVDSKLADTEEENPCVFLTKNSEDDYSYPDVGSIVGVDTYQGTSISFVDHITNFQQLVPGLLAGQRQIGDPATNVLIDVEQSKINIEADNVRVDGDNYKNTAGIQELIASQLIVFSDFITKFYSKGDIEFLTLAFLNLQAGRFSITGTENSSITAIQNLNFIVGLACQLTIGTDFAIQSSLGEIDIGNITTGMNITQDGLIELANLLGTIGIEPTGLLIAENTTTSLKTIISGIIDEINKIVVSYGTGPNVAALTALKTQMALLYK